MATLKTVEQAIMTNQSTIAREQLGELGEIVVVTGSSGCLGHQAVRLLLGRDKRVGEIRCLDLVEPNRVMRAELDNELAALEAEVEVEAGAKGEGEPARQAKGKRLRLFRGDIRDMNTVEQVLAGAHCVIHCAARQELWAEPRDQLEGELESVNVRGTENLLKACIRLAVPKFVHVSSFEVFTSFHTIYYATESTIPEPGQLLFGPSASTKRAAEQKVRQYANVKLKGRASGPRQLDSLRAVIVRFAPIYGEHDRHYVSKLLLLTKLLGGKLQRFTNIWIRQQPIYAGNAAWSLVRANRRLDVDESISGEEFHITDETAIGDPFDFMEPFAECRGMEVSKSTFPAWPVWFLLLFVAFLRSCLSALDLFGLFTHKKSRLDEAMELDEKRRHEQTARAQLDGASSSSASSSEEDRSQSDASTTGKNGPKMAPPRWYHLVTPQNFYFMCNSLFLNRTKASLRLDYEPIFSPDEALVRSVAWYKNNLEL